MKRAIETHTTRTPATRRRAALTQLQYLSAVLLLLLSLAVTGCDLLDSNAAEDDAHDTSLHASRGQIAETHPLGPPAKTPDENDNVSTLPEDAPGEEVPNAPATTWTEEIALLGPPVEVPGEGKRFRSPPVEAPDEKLLGTWEFALGQKEGPGKKRALPLATFTADGRVHLETDCGIYEGIFSTTYKGALTVSAFTLQRKMCDTLVEDPLVAALRATTTYKIEEGQLYIGYDGGTLLFNAMVSPAQF